MLDTLWGVCGLHTVEHHQVIESLRGPDNLQTATIHISRALLGLEKPGQQFSVLEDAAEGLRRMNETLSEEQR